jgi:chromosome segregation ATPase
LKTAKTNLEKVSVTHTQKLSEYEQTNLRLKTIVTEKEQLKFQTTAQKQEHEELEKKALAYEDDLAVVTGAKRALAITYNETLTHVKEVHDKLVEVQTGITSKRNDLATANTDHTKLFKELGELKVKYAALNQSEHDHELHAAQLAEKVLKEAAELETLKAEEEKEKQEIENLKTLLAELNEKISGSKGQLESHKKEVEEKVGLHKVARDTHEVKHNKLTEIKSAHTKVKTTHLDAQSKHQQLQKKIAQLELKLAGLNKDDENTESKLQALAALEAEERAVIEKSLASISELEAQVNAAKEELQSVYVKITEKDNEIIQHRESHKTVVTEYKTKIEEVSTKISQHDSILGQLYSLVEHGKSILREAKKAVSAKAKGGEHHHHVVVIEYSTSSSSY